MAELIRLSNGVRVALDPMPGLETAAVGVWIRVGARWEAAHENGVAHLFEHMAFKGAGGRDARAYAEEVEGLGASVNASTGYERTGYYGRCVAERTAETFDLVADIIRAPHWSVEELEKEKGVVLQEIGEAADQPDDRVFELHQAALFPGQALGRPILGTAETLAGITVATLEAFRDAHMSADRVAIAAAGRFDAEALLARAEARFGDLPAGAAAPAALAAPAGGVGLEARRLEQTHLALSWPGPRAGAAEVYAARVMCEILGGGMSSRLFQEVREKRGLVYAIDSYLELYEDVGRLGVYAGCGAKAAVEVVDLVADALEDLARDGPLGGELDRAKTTLAASLLMGAESPMARAESRAVQTLVQGTLIPFEDIRARIAAVTAEEVQAAARFAIAGPAAAAAIGAKAGHAGAKAAAARFAGPVAAVG